MGKFVDVSEHNTIDWAKAQKDVGAAYIRCGLRGSLAKTAPQDYKKIRELMMDINRSVVCGREGDNEEDLFDEKDL